MRLILNNIGYGLSIIGKLKETKVKNNLYYEIKDNIVEESLANNKVIRSKKLTKVYGLHSTTNVRNDLIELLRERMNLHKDKFISPTIYQELRGMEVKRNGKVEHSDLTHDDQIFSMLMALYVWYNGKNLRETFGIEKSAIQTEDSVDDIVELDGATELANMAPSIEKVNRLDNSELTKLERTLEEIKINQGMMRSDFEKIQKAHDETHLKMLLLNPVARQAYADKYKISADAVSFEDGTDYSAPNSNLGIPQSIFTDFYKDDSELTPDSIFYNMSAEEQQRIKNDDRMDQYQ